MSGTAASQVNCMLPPIMAALAAELPWTKTSFTSTPLFLKNPSAIATSTTVNGMVSTAFPIVTVGSAADPG